MLCLYVHDIANISRPLPVQAIQDVPLLIVGLILVKATFDNVLADYLWVRAIMLLSPTIATIGKFSVLSVVVSLLLLTRLEPSCCGLTVQV